MRAVMVPLPLFLPLMFDISTTISPSSSSMTSSHNNNGPALYAQPNAVVYENNCQTKCTCFPDKGLVCENHSCPKSTKCMVKKGIMACYNTGKKKN